MEKKYSVILPEDMTLLLECFADDDGTEASDFVTDIDLIATRIKYFSHMESTAPDEDRIAYQINKIVTFTGFVRENIDLILELVKRLKFTEMSEEEYKSMVEIYKKTVNENLMIEEEGGEGKQ